MHLTKIKDMLGITEIDVTIGSIVDGNGVGLFNTQGQPTDFYFDETTIEKPGLQVIVRHKSYEKGFEIINNIYKKLNKLEGFKPQQSPFFIGRNEKDYAEFSENYIVLEEGER